METPRLRRGLDSVANSRGRSLEHVAAGAGIVVGALVISAVIAQLKAPAGVRPQAASDDAAPEPPHIAPPRPAVPAVWPPLLLALAVSGFRIWNAPKSAARSQALTLWGLIQALNAAWMAFGPRRLPGQLGAAAATLGAGGAYVWRAKKVDEPAARMVAPYVSWISFAGVLTEELWRQTRDKPTIH